MINPFGSGVCVRMFESLAIVMLVGACASQDAAVADAGMPAGSEPELAVELAPAANAADSLTAEGTAPELPVVPVPTYDPEDVLWIQQRLKELGYYEGDVDGAVGRATRRAIRDYQADQDIEPDGKPTAEFREFMWRNGG